MTHPTHPDPPAVPPALRLADDAFPRARIRERDLAALAVRLRRNDCCHVLGPSNSGKSVLLHSLQTTAVRSRITVPDFADPIVAFVDCLDLYPRDAVPLPSHQYWPKQIDLLVEAMGAAGYSGRVLELLTKASEELGRSQSPVSGPLVDVRGFWPKVMQATLTGMVDAGLPEDACERFAQAHAAVVTVESSAQRELLAESALRALLTGRDEAGRQRPLILVLDEFDDVFALAGPSAWRTLRRIRDDFDRDGLRLALVVATCRDLDAHRVVEQGVEDDPSHEFRELFQHDPLVLGPVSDAEAHALLSYVVADRGVELGDGARARAIHSAGGHVGLLCQLAESLSAETAEHGDDAEGEALRSLLRAERIRAECARLWNELGRDCHIALTLWHRGTLPEHHPSAALLQRQGILDERGKSLCSPLFEAFVRARYVENLEEERRGIYFDAEQGLFYLEDRPLVLPDRLQSVLAVLYDAPGEWLSVERVWKLVWGASGDVNIVQQYLRKLRHVLGETPSAPRFVFNKAGHGYQLVRTGDRRPPDATITVRPSDDPVG